MSIDPPFMESPVQDLTPRSNALNNRSLVSQAIGVNDTRLATVQMGASPMIALGKSIDHMTGTIDELNETMKKIGMTFIMGMSFIKQGKPAPTTRAVMPSMYDLPSVSGNKFDLANISSGGALAGMSEARSGVKIGGQRADSRNQKIDDISDADFSEVSRKKKRDMQDWLRLQYLKNKRKQKSAKHLQAKAERDEYIKDSINGMYGVQGGEALSALKSTAKAFSPITKLTGKATDWAMNKLTSKGKSKSGQTPNRSTKAASVRIDQIQAPDDASSAIVQAIQQQTRALLIGDYRLEDMISQQSDVLAITQKNFDLINKNEKMMIDNTKKSIEQLEDLNSETKKIFDFDVAQSVRSTLMGAIQTIVTAMTSPIGAVGLLTAAVAGLAMTNEAFRKSVEKLPEEIGDFFYKANLFKSKEDIAAHNLEMSTKKQEYLNSYETKEERNLDILDQGTAKKLSPEDRKYIKERMLLRQRALNEAASNPDQSVFDFKTMADDQKKIDLLIENATDVKEILHEFRHNAGHKTSMTSEKTKSVAWMSPSNATVQIMNLG